MIYNVTRLTSFNQKEVSKTIVTRTDIGVKLANQLLHKKRSKEGRCGLATTTTDRETEGGEEYKPRKSSSRVRWLREASEVARREEINERDCESC